eukprot:RCo005854
MIEENAVKGLVHAVVEDVLVLGSPLLSLRRFFDDVLTVLTLRLLCRGLVAQHATADHCGDEAVRGSREEAPGLRDHRGAGEELAQGLLHHLSDLGEAGAGIRAREAAPNIQDLHGEAKLYGFLPHRAGRTNCLKKGLSISTSTPNMETKPDNGKSKVLGNMQETRDVLQGCAKLGAQPAQALGVICGNAQERLRLRVVLLQLQEPGLAVENHSLDSSLQCALQVGNLERRVRVDDPLWAHPQAQNYVEFPHTGAIKAAAHPGKSLDNSGATITLYRVERSHGGKVLPPQLHLLCDLPKVDDVHGFLRGVVLGVQKRHQITNTVWSEFFATGEAEDLILVL